jgi:hypothetical protein
METSGGARWIKRKVRVKDEQGRRCLFCGRRLPLTLDHIRKQADGGTCARRNVRAICSACHQIRHHAEDLPFTSRLILALQVLKGGSRISLVDRVSQFLFDAFTRPRNVTFGSLLRIP